MSTTGRRPGDVTFEKWAEGKGLAIDVAVTSPLAPTYVRLVEPCEWYIATKNMGSMMLVLQPLVKGFETLGVAEKKFYVCCFVLLPRG